tara:strand:- start:1029 stop:1676 length:648 start_codon:yes stop_codon:yes gene_type:complete
MLNYKKYMHPGGGTPKTLIIFLHGYGANGLDLLDIGKLWAQLLPKTVFLSPDAPDSCEMGGGGFQWFSLKTYTPEVMKAGADKVVDNLVKFILEKKEEYKIQDGNVFLVGFSQGTMMSLHAASHLGKKLGGVVGYSGAYLYETIEEDNIIAEVPICLVHGDNDPVVPVDATHMAEKTLSSSGATINKYIIPGLQHGIDQQGLKIGVDFIKKNLSK